MNKYQLFKTIGFVCMQRREQQKISIRKLAKKCHTTHTSLAAFERGETNSFYSFLCYINMLSDLDLITILHSVEGFINDN